MPGIKMYPEFSIRKYLYELVRPWKLITFFVALSYYIWGAYYYRLPTWDVPVSVIMSVLTYVFSPWVVKSGHYLMISRPPFWLRKMLVCIAVTYFCASGSYELYHMFFGIGYHPPTYWANLYYSTLMFIAAGIFWKFEGSWKELYVFRKKEFDAMPPQKKNSFIATMGILITLFVGAMLWSLKLPRL